MSAPEKLLPCPFCGAESFDAVDGLPNPRKKCGYHERDHGRTITCYENVETALRAKLETAVKGLEAIHKGSPHCAAGILARETLSAINPKAE
jgi:hypothetical protein